MRVDGHILPLRMCYPSLMLMIFFIEILDNLLLLYLLDCNQNIPIFLKHKLFTHYLGLQICFKMMFTLLQHINIYIFKELNQVIKSKLKSWIVPSLIIMDLKYMLKRSTQRLSDTHRVCLMVEHNMLVV